MKAFAENEKTSCAVHVNKICVTGLVVLNGTFVRAIFQLFPSFKAKLTTVNRALVKQISSMPEIWFN